MGQFPQSFEVYCFTIEVHAGGQVARGWLQRVLDIGFRKGARRPFRRVLKGATPLRRIRITQLCRVGYVIRPSFRKRPIAINVAAVKLSWALWLKNVQQVYSAAPSLHKFLFILKMF